ncbi:hypothetical protein B0O40_2435 [Ruminococcaceae bacterium R-25]|nr:hypothetical protein B0O40_2435 [Ruminococcaceae bacterium R-25]SUQ22286.1 hypothetical protein SAMN06297423_2435 [Oscillospiraceae bacterium]
MSLPPKIVDKYGSESFGGSQMWLPDEMFVNSGCGIIAGLDAIMRLKGEDGMTRDEYFDRFFDAKDYIRPITIGKNRKERKLFGKEFFGSFGVSAGRFRRGIRKLAVKEGLNIRVKPFLYKWWEKIPQYLEGGDPLVMLFVSPFRKICVEEPSGYKVMCQYHWVTITEIDGDDLWVSSWGDRCKMSVTELKSFGVILRFYSVSLEKRGDIV